MLLPLPIMGEGGGEGVREGKYTGFVMLQTMSEAFVYRIDTESPIVNSISASLVTSRRV